MFDDVQVQFIYRASSIFPPDMAVKWSRIERAVFNHLMSQLIYHHGYEAITCQMLHETRDRMQQILRSLGSNLSDEHGSALAGEF